jgi:hypothetical protein
MLTGLAKLRVLRVKEAILTVFSHDSSLRRAYVAAGIQEAITTQGRESQPLPHYLAPRQANHNKLSNLGDLGLNAVKS